MKETSSHGVFRVGVGVGNAIYIKTYIAIDSEAASVYCNGQMVPLVASVLTTVTIAGGTLGSV